MRILLALLFLLWGGIAEAQVITGGQPIVGNQGMALMPPNTLKCNPSNSLLNPADCNLPTFNVRDYGATGNGSTDDTAAINNTIAACPLTSCKVIFPLGTYKISAQISLGNGTSSSASTRTGIYLEGVGDPNSFTVFGPYTQGTPTLLWAGTTNQNVIAVNGPLMGWGVANLQINCGVQTGSTGLRVVSGEFGEVKNLAIMFCNNGIVSQTYQPFGSLTITDSIHNAYTNINIQSATGMSTVFGILVTGPGGGGSGSDTDGNVFNNISILLPGGAGLGGYGIYLQQSDGNVFIGTHIYGGNTTSVGVLFDYAITNLWPASNYFYGIDPGLGNGGGAFSVNGTPGAGATPNYLFGLAETNGATCPVGIANLVVYCSHEYRLVPRAIATLLTCNANSAGARAVVNNAVASPTYGATVSTTGANTAPVFCNGTNWIYD